MSPVAEPSTASPGPAPWTRALLGIVAGAAVYGAVLGSWHGARLAAYAALKLPLLLLLTALLTAAFDTVVARALGLALDFRGSILLALGCLARAAVLLASLAPVAALFTWTLPLPTVTARGAHNFLYLFHTAATGGCGLAGALALRQQLRAAAPSPRAARQALVAWVFLFALVGGEIAWALRPFVGSVYEPVSFLREDALDGNVYEFVWTDILPYLARRIAGGEP